MLIWDCLEVGRNDAANLVNAVFGARVLSRHKAVMIAAVAVILGATFSAPVMETARKGIFDPTVLTIEKAISIYIAVYFVDTVLLYGFSGFGMPVSTTACLVFELVGAALFLAGPENVQWPKVMKVLSGIILSIVISGIGSFLIMRVFRGAIRDKSKDRATVFLHGPWISGAMLTWLTWFLVFKGLKNVSFVKDLKALTFDVHGPVLVLFFIWAGMTALLSVALILSRQRLNQYLFSATAVLGMICLAFAFGQNDLANAASPGLASLALWQSGSGPTDLADIASKIPIPIWALFGCGLLMALGMFSDYAQRVTRAAINTGSQFDQVTLYAPGWCKAIARGIIRVGERPQSLAPEPSLTSTGKKVHYDALRASVITGVSAGVIAYASGQGIPVSTTYVAFAAVLGSGAADRIFSRGDADTKMGRAIWVVTCWFLAPVVAILAAGTVARIVYHLSAVGIIICILLNLGVRYLFKRRSDRHEQMHHVEPATKEEGI